MTVSRAASGLLALVSTVSVVACQQAPTPGSDASNTQGDAALVDASGGTEAGTDAGPTSLAYTPQGCSYMVRTPAGVRSAAMGTDATFGTAPTPAAVHVSLPADPRSTIAVLWNTDVGTTATVVQYGESRDALTSTARGHVMTGGTAIGGTTVGLLTTHEVHLCGLTAGRTYYYRVGGEGHWSDVYSFTTAPADGSTAIDFAVDGDSRDNFDTWRQTQEQILMTAGAQIPDFSLFTGDAVQLGQVQSAWDQWFAGGAATLQRMPFVMAHGNHDALAINYLMQVAQPQVGDPTQDELYFSFDYGPVHVVVLNDTPPNGDYALVSGAEVSWLRQDLMRADANRANVPWIVVAHHKPCYSSSNHAQDTDTRLLRTTLPPVFDQYHVDVVFSGHDHDFEMTQPVRGGMAMGSGQPSTVTRGTGTVYVTAAGAGASLYSLPDVGSAPLRRYGESAVNFVLVHASRTRLELSPYRMANTGASVTPIREATVALVVPTT